MTNNILVSLIHERIFVVTESPLPAATARRSGSGKLLLCRRLMGRISRARLSLKRRRRMSLPALLEICVDNAQGLDIATTFGADRIELCAGLALGGLTPSVGMMHLAAMSGCPTRVMIRPRGGGFTYNDDELDVMLHDIDSVAAIGLEGVVFGANRPGGLLDENALFRLTNHARGHGLKVTLHRSFDLVPDPLQALTVAQDLRIDTILTSGGQASAWEGLKVIEQLVKAIHAQPARPAVDILAGGGIDAANVHDVIVRGGVSSIHASCSSEQGTAPSRAVTLGFASARQRETDADLVKGLRLALDRMPGARADNPLTRNRNHL